MRTLGLGAKGQDVLDLQCALASGGCLTGDLDGSFGPATEAAVRLYQQKHSLSVSGTAEAQTAASLNLRERATPALGLSGVDAASLAKIFPQAQPDDLQRNLPHVINALVEADLVSTEVLAMALATIRTEASRFLPLSERQSSMNTSVAGVPFDLYDNRAALGNRGAPDGANYRGRGFIQLTGRANYLRFGQEIGMGSRLVNNPLLAHDPEIAGKLLASFLKYRRSSLQKALQQKDLAAARRVVNGSTIGLQPFVAAFHDCIALLPEKISSPPQQRVA